MKRRVILVVGTLALCLLLLWVFYVFDTSGGSGASRDATGERRSTRPAVRSSERDKLAGGAAATRIFDREKDGRLRALYKVAEWQGRGDGRFDLLEPDVTMYQADGTRVYLRADEGTIIADEVAGGYAIHSGRLSGNVRVFFDRAKDPNRSNPEERPEDVVEIRMDHVELDNRQLSITTDSDVMVWSAEADIIGRGLTIHWNENPQELTLLRIEHGESVIIKKMPAGFDVVSVPTTGGPAPASRPAAKATPTPEPVASAPVATRTAETKPGKGRARRARTPATSASAPSSRPPRNVYRAEFIADQRDVRVHYGDRHLFGAKKLSLEFEWDRSIVLGEEEPDSTAAGAAGTSEASTQTGTRKSETTAASQGTTQPAIRPSEKKAGDLMIIDWSGPLEITPVRHEPQPNRKRYTVIAEGEMVDLTDPEAQALCQRFEFRSMPGAGEAAQLDRREGRLIGSARTPVRLLTAGGEEIVAETMVFDSLSEEAHLNGPGYLVTDRGQLGEEPAPATRPAEAALPDEERPSGRVSWTKGVVAKFDRYETVGDDGEPEAKLYVKEALFDGDVELTQADSDDYIRCDELEVWMKLGVGGLPYPHRAEARGGVTGRQEGSDLAAEKASLTFARVADVDSEGKSRFRTRPETLVASGKVHLTTQEQPAGESADEQAETIVATCDRLRSELEFVRDSVTGKTRMQRTAVLFGKPARIEQGPNSLSGPEIHLDERDESARVPGEGTLSFLTRKDFDGGELAEPREVNIAWDKQMEYHGRTSTATFIGGVELDSGPERIECHKMGLLFEKESPTTRPAEEPDTPVREGLTPRMERYSSRRISIIRCDGDILARSVRMTGEKTERRFQVKGDQFIYDAIGDRITMLKPGTMLVEDYRPPRPRKENEQRDETNIAGRAERPSQTYIEWKERMEFMQADRLAIAEGDVIMMHRSGKQVVLQERLKVPDWPELTEGRSSDLRCGKLMARFAEPDPSASTKPSSEDDPLDAGARVGPLEMFKATRQVTLKDNGREVAAQRVVYDRGGDFARMWGYLEGRRAAIATLSYVDDKGRAQTVRGSDFTFFFKNNYFFGKDVEVVGGR